MKKVIIGADHGGIDIKEALKKALMTMGYDVNDIGTHSTDSIDYPDIANPLAQSVANNEYDFGVLVCGTGNGVCIAANKQKGVRAGLAWAPEIGELVKQHNNANILCIPGRFVEEEVAIATLKAYLDAEFEGGRHERRINKLGS